MFHFRPASPDDIGPLFELVNSAYRGDSSRQGWTTEADLLGGQRVDPDMLREMMTSAGYSIRLILRSSAETSEYSVAGGELLGCVNLKIFNGPTKENPEAPNTKSCYLGLLTTRPDLQNQGIGRHLIEDSENWARSQGAETMWMTVINVRSELIAWYVRRGYARTGRLVDFPIHDARFGLPQVSADALRLEILEKPL